jgi:type II secretory pathway pseudopilin PulG
MVEVAISLAIIGVALVAIIGVLPIGMNTQRDNREETTVNQDATVLLEAIRNGSQGADDLTNYVYAITNYSARFDTNGVFLNYATYGYDNRAASYLTNGANIIGLMSTPEFTRGGQPIPNVYNGGRSNHIVAYVRSMSGVAAEKPPQDSDIMRDNSFTYRVLCVNAPTPMDLLPLVPLAQQPYARQIFINQHELRMTFLWPQLPNGKVGSGRLTFRATIAGQIMQTNDLYFYQSQSFTNAP